MQASCIDNSGIGKPFLDIHLGEANVAILQDKLWYGDHGPRNDLSWLSPLKTSKQVRQHSSDTATIEQSNSCIVYQWQINK